MNHTGGSPETPAETSPETPAETSGRPPHIIATTVWFWLIGLICVLIASRKSMHTDFFFDEAWRSDIIRSSHPFTTMGTIKTPIPPLWPWVLHFTSFVVGGRFGLLRLQGNALAALCPALAGQLVRVLAFPRLAERRRAWTRGLLIGSVATVATASCLTGLLVTAYFNDYSFQGALVLALVLTMYCVDKEWTPLWAVLPALLLMSVGTLSGLFVLPVVGWWALRRSDRSHRNLLVPALGVSGLIAIGLYFAVYRYQVDDSLTSFWADHLLRNGTQSLAETLLGLVRLAGIVVFPFGHSDLVLVPLGVGLLGLAVFGFITLRKEWAWLGRLGSGAWIVAALASIAVSWPADTVRVNVPFLVLWCVGAIYGLWYLAQRFAGRFAMPALILVLGPIAAIAIGVTHWDPSRAFAKGMDSDMQPIRDSKAPKVLVIGYHFMSVPYLHDGLINRRDDAGRYVFIQDTLDQPLDELYLPGLVEDEGLQPDDEVWCVVPFEVGAEVAERACQLGDLGYDPIYTHRGQHSIIIGFRVTFGE